MWTAHPDTPDEGWLGWSLPPLGAYDRSGLEQIAQALAATHLPWSRLQHYVRFDAKAYVRQTIFRGETWEMLLLCWLPGQASAVHDHEGSSGVVRLLTGVLEETCFDSLEERRATRRHTQRAGAVLVELPETVHRVENVGDGPALSLHLYSPPLPERP